MIHPPHFRSWRTSLARLTWRDDCAAQLVEFAVALPLLVVFVVGIFDFSGAFTLKQKFTNVARDAARAAAADPASDLGGTFTAGAVPASVSDAFQIVDNYLVIANKLNDCGVTLAGRSGLTWTYTGTGSGCPAGGLTIIINRGYYFPANSTQVASVTCAAQDPGGQIAVLSTCVRIQYAYQWRFGRVASLLGSTTALPNTITATAVAMNEN